MEMENRAMEERLKQVKRLKNQMNFKKKTSVGSFTIKTKKRANKSIKNEEIKRSQSKADEIHDKTLEAFISNIRQKEDVFDGFLKDTNCYQFKDKFVEEGICDLNDLKEVDIQTYNTMGITNKKQETIENCLYSKYEHMLAGNESKSIAIQTDDGPVNETNNEILLHSEKDIAQPEPAQSRHILEDLGGLEFDFDELMGIEKKQEKREEKEEKELFCYNCFKNHNNESFKLKSNTFCSDACLDSYQNKQAKRITKIVEFEEQVDRYNKMIKETAIDPIINMNITKPIDKDVDLNFTLEIDYGEDRLIH